jgi:glycosyltransferase involved in cell wall biosynthesis
MRVLLFNLRMDADDTALGFTTAWTNAIARRVESVEAITMHAGRLALEPNVEVHSVGRERGASRPARVLRFYRDATDAALRRRPDVCFAHMTPLFASMFWPIARLRGIPVLLWYAHGSVPRDVRLAHRLVDRCVTSTPSGLRIVSPKVHVLHQGIDTAVFHPPADEAQRSATTVLSVGRMTASKNLVEVVEVVADLRRRGFDLTLRLIGGPITDLDRGYLERIHEAVRAHGLDGHVELAGPIGHDEIAAEYRRAGWFLNLSATGSLDKAILEAMASGCVPISANESFRALAHEDGLSELVPAPGLSAPADALERALQLKPARVAQLRAHVRSVVERRHSLDALADEIVGHLADLAQRRLRARIQSEPDPR